MFCRSIRTGRKAAKLTTQSADASHAADHEHPKARTRRSGDGGIAEHGQCGAAQPGPFRRGQMSSNGRQPARPHTKTAGRHRLLACQITGGDINDGALGPDDSKKRDNDGAGGQGESRALICAGPSVRSHAAGDTALHRPTIPISPEARTADAIKSGPNLDRLPIIGAGQQPRPYSGFRAGRQIRRQSRRSARSCIATLRLANR